MLLQLEYIFSFLSNTNFSFPISSQNVFLYNVSKFFISTCLSFQYFRFAFCTYLLKSFRCLKRSSLFKHFECASAFSLAFSFKLNSFQRTINSCQRTINSSDHHIFDSSFLLLTPSLIFMFLKWTFWYISCQIKLVKSLKQLSASD